MIVMPFEWPRVMSEVSVDEEKKAYSEALLHKSHFISRRLRTQFVPGAK